MSENVTVAVITGAGVVLSALLSALATVRAARISAAKGEAESTPRRELVGWGVVAGLGVAALTLSAIALAFHQLRAEPDVPPGGDLSVFRQVGELRVTSAKDSRAVAPWEARNGLREGDVRVEPVAGAGPRGADGALRMTVDLPGGAGDDRDAGVRIPGDRLPEGVRVATAWVWVDDSEQARRAGLEARIGGYLNGGSAGRIEPLGDWTPLKPGAWTPVAWAGSYGFYLSPALRTDSSAAKLNASSRLISLSVYVRGAEGYQGSVYVDDLRLYR